MNGYQRGYLRKRGYIYLDTIDPAKIKGMYNVRFLIDNRLCTVPHLVLMNLIDEIKSRQCEYEFVDKDDIVKKIKEGVI